MNRGLFTSLKDDWETPQDLFDELHNQYGFTIDVCANESNKKCKTYYDKTLDALKQKWSGVCWMNPPYGREIGKWMKKAYEESKHGAVIVCLVPARTDTAWWHDYAANGSIKFLRGRLKFKGAKYNAPFPSAIVVFGSIENNSDLTCI